MKILKLQYVYYSILFTLILIGVFLRLEYYNDGIWGDEWIGYFFSNPDVPLNLNYRYFLEFEGSPIINVYFNIFWNYLFGFNYQSQEIGSLIIGFFLLISTFYFFTEDVQKNIFFLFLFISNPFLAYYSGEVRFYSTSVFFTFISVIFFFELIKKKTFQNIFLFITFSVIASSINIFSTAIYISIFVFCFLKKKYNFFIYIFIIGVLFLIFNLSYIINISNLYTNSGAGSDNFSLNFLLGLYFNIFFGNKFFGGFVLLTILYYFFFLNKKILNTENEKIFLFYLIIFFAYLIPILYGLIKQPISYPRHFIYIIPFIIYLFCTYIFQIKKKWLKYTLIILVIFFSIFTNVTQNKPYILSKENPEWVINYLNKSKIKNIYLTVNNAEKISRNISHIDNEKKDFLVGDVWYYYSETSFLHSKYFDQNRFKFINKASDANKFWTLCNNDLSDGIKKIPERCKINQFIKTHNIIKFVNKEHFTLRLYSVK